MRASIRPPLDYRLLQALDAVISEQGFERAARRLHLTQSAISQRIRQLEEQLAQPLLIRGTPLQTTPAGQALLVHYRQIHQLEQNLLPQLQPDAPQQPLSVSIAVNADSLATWLVPALAPLLCAHPLALNVVVDDETRTHQRLRQGEVFAAVLPEELRDTLDRTALMVPRRDQLADTTDVGLLREAIRRERVVSIDYRNEQGEESQRTVWPFALAYFERVRVVLAWCELRGDFRSFRTDRISALSETGRRYPRRRAALLAEWKATQGMSPSAQP